MLYPCLEQVPPPVHETLAFCVLARTCRSPVCGDARHITPFRLPWARWSGCWRGATRPFPPATVAPPGDRQSPTST
eukprot:5929238-Prymnesium_polylepis.1